jgi:hypothetical protein
MLFDRKRSRGEEEQRTPRSARCCTTEDSERYCRGWLEEFVRQDGARRLETSRLAASPVGRGRRGEGWPKEELSRVSGHQEKGKETTSEESKHSGTCRGEATVNSFREKRSKEYLQVRGIAVIEDDGRTALSNPMERRRASSRYTLCRELQISCLACRTRQRGEGWAIEGSTGAQARSGKASEAAFQLKCSGSEREVAMSGHQEKSTGGRRELCLGEPKHTFGRGKGDELASSRVQNGLENNEGHCYSTDKVGKAREAHTAPPPVVQTSHSPPIPSPTRSKRVTTFPQPNGRTLSPTTFF